MKRKKNKNYANCPCCKKGRHSTEMERMINLCLKLFPKYQKRDIFEFLKNNQFVWACDVCLDAGLAIFAKPIKQKPSYLPPLVYFNTEHKCQNCKKDFMFYGKEKQFWYEELKFSTSSKPINCLDCRKVVRNKKNENTRLSDILINGEENLTKEELEELIIIYAKWEMIERRKYFENKLKKKENENKNNRSS